LYKQDSRSQTTCMGSFCIFAHNALIRNLLYVREKSICFVDICRWTKLHKFINLKKQTKQHLKFPLVYLLATHFFRKNSPSNSIHLHTISVGIASGLHEIRKQSEIHFLSSWILYKATNWFRVEGRPLNQRHRQNNAKM
jgi:hypothetical protein